MNGDGKKRVAMFIVLMILTLFCSTVRAAEEACDAGDGESKWTLLINDTKIYLKGNICGAGNGEWEARNLKGNKVFYNGTYALIGGHSEKSQSNSDKRIGW